MSTKYAIAMLFLCGFTASAGITNIFIGTSPNDHTGTPLRSASIIINTNFATVENDINNATNTAALAANGLGQTNVGQVWTGTQNFKGALQQNSQNVLTNLGTAPDAATFNAATATTASGLSGTLTIGNLPPFVITNYWAASAGYVYYSNAVVICQSNANAGLMVSNGANYVIITNGNISGSGQNNITISSVSLNASSIVTKSGGATGGNLCSWNSTGNLPISDSGINKTNPAFAGYGSFTNGFGVLATNVAPTSVTLGVTAPDFWNSYTNTAGQKVFTPGWLNH
jgi:hypothetical protein